MCHSVLDELKSMKKFVWDACQNCVAVVCGRCYQGVDKHFSGVLGECRAQSRDVPEMEKRSSTDITNAVGVRECCLG